MRFSPQTCLPQIEAIAAAWQRMPAADADRWHAHMRLVYGDMAGQRGVDFSSFAGHLDRNATIFALESIYSLIAQLIAIASFHPQPQEHLRSTSRRTGVRLDRYLRQLIRGDRLRRHGVLVGDDPLAIDWLFDQDRTIRDALRDLIAQVAELWQDDTSRILGDDPLQEIHRQLFPANLTHISGQFYSPPWLARLLLSDAQWNPDQRLIDPYCGSGVFFVTALRAAEKQGCCLAETAERMCGIDLHPFAVVAARANLARMLAQSGRDLPREVTLDVRCDDAITSSTRIDKADVVATNPPWVGWEYLSRPYRDSIQEAWIEHDLFQARGMEASFLKEDLSNLALLAAWDRYLRDGGRSVVVLRPSTMHSEVASRGVRRLTLHRGRTPLRLRQIRTFPGLRLFKSADTPVAAWMIEKGKPTEFPVPVIEFRKRRSRWNPAPGSRLDDLTIHVAQVDKLAEPTDPRDAMSRWMIARSGELNALRRLRGSNRYTPRMGVFTGGANGVFYLRPSKRHNGSHYQNITSGSRRKVAEVDVTLEPDLLHSVARGRDIHPWSCRPEVLMLLPHTCQSQMLPLGPDELASRYPQTHRYLHTMQQPLRSRNGFAGWEKKIQNRFFYALQRVGAYTFAPYKVCWRYISNRFIVSVVGHDADGKVIVPNDKVMFIPLEDADEAYFVAGFLSSDLVGRYVASVIEKRQISTGVIKSLAIPDFDPDHPLHQQISRACRQGHETLQEDATADVGDLRKELNRGVEELIGTDCSPSDDG